MELTYPVTKRIKLEHSYAFDFESNQVEDTKIKEEDPLEILEDTSIIKLETEEDVVIKNEVPEDVKNDANGNFEYFNLPSVSAELENYSDSTSGSLVVGESGICTNESNSLGTNNVTSIVDPLTLVDNCDEMVPKHILLELQKQYLNTIETLKQRNTLLVIDADKLAKENRKLSNTMFEKIPSTILPSPRDKVLAAKVKELKKELYIVKANEKSLAAQLQLRNQSEKNLEKIKTQDCMKEINDLKHNLEVMSTQLKVRQKVFDIMKENYEHSLKDLMARLEADNHLKSLKSVHPDVNLIKNKTISDIVEVHQYLVKRTNKLKELFRRLNKKIDRTHNNLNIQRQLHSAQKVIIYLKKSFYNEKKELLSCLKGKNELLDELKRKLEKTEKELLDVKQTLSFYKGLLSKIKKDNTFES